MYLSCRAVTLHGGVPALRAKLAKAKMRSIAP